MNEDRQKGQKEARIGLDSEKDIIPLLILMNNLEI